MDLGAMCDRAALRLYDRPTNRDDLADIATVLLLTNERLQLAVHEYGRLNGATRRAMASNMAVTAVDRRLAWLGQGGADAPDDTFRRVADKALHLMVRVIGVLAAPAGRSPIPSEGS